MHQVLAEGPGLGQQGAEALGPGPADESVGVLALWQHGHPGAGAGGEEGPGQPFHGGTSGGVSIQQQHQVAGLGAPQHFQVAGGKGGAAEGDGRLQPGLVQRHGVEVALHQDGGVLSAHVMLGDIQGEQGVTLVVEAGLTRVEVLRPLVPQQQPSAEGQGTPIGGADGHHQPAAEDVVGALAFGAPLHQAGLQSGLQHAAADQLIGQPCPGLRCPAQAKGPCRFFGNGPGGQRLAREAALDGVPQQALEMALGQGRHLAQLLAFLGARVLGTLQLHPHLPGKLAYGVDEGLALQALQEGDGVAARLAAEALEALHLRRHVEGGALLLVEGAAALEAAAGLLQLDMPAHQCHQVDALEDLFYFLLWNQARAPPRPSPALGSTGRCSSTPTSPASSRTASTKDLPCKRCRKAMASPPAWQPKHLKRFISGVT